MVPAPRCLSPSLARSLALRAERRAQLTSAWAAPARSPAARSPRRSAGGGERRQGAKQRTSRRLLDHPWRCGDPELPALQPAGRSAGAPRLRRRAGALRSWVSPAGLRDSPTASCSSLGPQERRSRPAGAVQPAAGRPLCWPGLRALAGWLPALSPAPSSARGVRVAMAAAPALHK